MIRIKLCKDADAEHHKSERQYAHVGHRKGTICIAYAFNRLPLKLQLGILLHELGHLAGAEGEDEADRLATKLFGVKVKREDTEYGAKLETV